MKAPMILLVAAFLVFGSLVSRADNPFCSNCEATRNYYRKFCDYVAAEKKDVPIIFIGGYYMRDLVAGYKIFGNKQYLDVAVAYADSLLKKQSERGYWETGYGRIYLADTGSALGLFAVLYKHVDRDRQRKYLDAMQRYVDAIERDKMIRASGALDVGLKLDANGLPTTPYGEDYTISSALTGGEIYTWMFDRTRTDKYRDVAYHSMHWVLSTMRDDGVIPYNHPTGKSDLRIHGNKTNDFKVWEESLYLTSAYVGEGLQSFDLYCAKPEWKQEFRTRIKPHIDYILRTQNPNGTWAVDGPWDQKRSPGIVNFLIWYYGTVEKDPRIVRAIERFKSFILVPENAKKFGLLNDGAVPPNAKQRNSYECVTSLTGRAIADMIRPGIDAEW